MSLQHLCISGNFNHFGVCPKEEKKTFCFPYILYHFTVRHFAKIWLIFRAIFGSLKK